MNFWWKRLCRNRSLSLHHIRPRCKQKGQISATKEDSKLVSCPSHSCIQRWVAIQVLTNPSFDPKFKLQCSKSVKQNEEGATKISQLFIRYQSLGMKMMGCGKCCTRPKALESTAIKTLRPIEETLTLRLLLNLALDINDGFSTTIV